MKNLDESDLLARLKNGDADSFSLLYRQYAKRIYSLSHKMTGDREDAEDITQKTFFQAYLSLGKFRGESQLSTWLYTIARNLCLQCMQQKKKSSFSSFEELPLSAHSEERCEPHSEFDRKYYVNQIREVCLLGLLRSLSLNQRMAFILNVLLDVEVKTVAKVLEKSESATRTLVHRAKRNLKSFLCANCSYYDSKNPCACKNFIDFSLKQGLIDSEANGTYNGGAEINGELIEREINEMNKVVMLYHSLQECQPSRQIAEGLQEMIADREYFIFSNKKVK